MTALIALLKKTLPLAAGFAAGVLALAMVAGQVYARVERRRIDWIGVA